LKVLIINKHISYALGGSEMQCDLIAKGLSQIGHQVVYGAVCLPKDFEPSFSYNYTIVDFDKSSRVSVKGFLEKHKPDVIYWRYNKHGLDKIIPVAKSLDIPFVYAVSHINDVTRFAYKPMKSKGLKGKLKSKLSILKQKLQSARQFSYLKDISGLTSLNSEFIGKLEVPLQKVIKNAVTKVTESFSSEQPYVAWVSSIKASKRPEAYIELAKNCKDLEFLFLMIGPIHQQSYEQVVSEAESLTNFRYLGKRTPEEVNGILKNAQLLVHTCEPEGFGNNFIQAWMQGIPTVSLSFDPDNIILKQGLGFVSGTHDQMQKDVRRLLEDAKLRKEMGSKAKKYASQHFSEERLSAEVEEFLTKIVDENRIHS
jgi:glycosyltransferase involved in cell wall biosynthesis